MSSTMNLVGVCADPSMIKLTIDLFFFIVLILNGRKVDCGLIWEQHSSWRLQINLSRAQSPDEPNDLQDTGLVPAKLCPACSHTA